MKCIGIGIASQTGTRQANLTSSLSLEQAAQSRGEVTHGPYVYIGS